MTLPAWITRLIRRRPAHTPPSPRTESSVARALLESRACTRLQWLLEARFGDAVHLVPDPDRVAADPVLRVIVRVTGRHLAQQTLIILYIIRHVMEYYGLPFQASIQSTDAQPHTRADRVR
ncbi:MAG: hypothetical protein HY962_10120 [Ignavibacteriae bacterium]|nr:hypothetical protein [Ignavibacteriota bacterium]